MITIIDYNAGNIGSVKNALENLGFEYEITNNPEKILNAKKVIFPGVGRAGSAIKDLKEKGLDKILPQIKAPFLGICLGMQLLAKSSEEDDTKCLNIIPGQIKKFETDVKIPQIGWNQVKITQNSKLFRDIPDNSYFYFVNSFYFETENKYTIGQTEYGKTFTSATQNNNFFGVQFHPEKSGEIGLKLLKNFCEL